MAKINLPKIIESLEHEVKATLAEMFEGLGIEEKIDKEKLFRAFRDRVRYNFRHSTDVPDDAIESKET